MNPMPTYAVFHFRFHLGNVSAVSYKQALQRARAAYPGKRIMVELALNVPTTDKDRLAANNRYAGQCNAFN